MQKLNLFFSTTYKNYNKLKINTNFKYFSFYKPNFRKFAERDNIIMGKDFKSKLKKQFGGKKKSPLSKEDIDYKTNFDHIQIEV
jgi:hypothetical protein